MFGNHNFSWVEQRQKSGISAAVQGLPGAKIVDAEGGEVFRGAGGSGLCEQTPEQGLLADRPRGKLCQKLRAVLFDKDRVCDSRPAHTGNVDGGKKIGRASCRERVYVLV